MSDNVFPKLIKQLLWNAISDVAADIRSHVVNPGKDFTRERKLGFQKLIRFLISMESSSQKMELLSFFQYRNPPSASALNQQRKKLARDAMETVFLTFNRKIPFRKTYQGFHLFACDGTDLNIARNPADTDTAYCSGSAGHSALGYNMIHLNALYDLKERRYFDAVIQPGRKKNEFRAICDMIDRLPDDMAPVSLFIGDRGFCSYNVFAHVVEKGTFFLLRAKDHDSKGMVKNLPLPDTPRFDATVEITFIRRRTKKLLALPGIIRHICKETDFDYITYGTDETCRMSLRIVRAEIGDGHYECLVTNLPPDEFPLPVVKELYHMRWGIETSFRELKYATWLKYFHSKKREFIEQEIWARLILYNFCEIITTHVVIEQKKEWKHAHQVNFTMAIHICHKFLRWKDDNVDPPDVKGLIASYTEAIRPGRNFTRKVKFQMPASFLYR